MNCFDRAEVVISIGTDNILDFLFKADGVCWEMLLYEEEENNE